MNKIVKPAGDWERWCEVCRSESDDTVRISGPMCSGIILCRPCAQAAVREIGEIPGDVKISQVVFHISYLPPKCDGCGAKLAGLEIRLPNGSTPTNMCPDCAQAVAQQIAGLLEVKP